MSSLIVLASFTPISLFVIGRLCPSAWLSVRLTVYMSTESAPAFEKVRARFAGILIINKHRKVGVYPC